LSIGAKARIYSASPRHGTKYSQKGEGLRKRKSTPAQGWGGVQRDPKGVISFHRQKHAMEIRNRKGGDRRKKRKMTWKKESLPTAREKETDSVCWMGGAQTARIVENKVAN